MSQNNIMHYIGTLFSSRLREASGEFIKHSEAFRGFRKGLPSGVAEEINEKIAMWNIDPDNNENPYQEEKQGEIFTHDFRINNEREF